MDERILDKPNSQAKPRRRLESRRKFEGKMEDSNHEWFNPSSYFSNFISSIQLKNNKSSIRPPDKDHDDSKILKADSSVIKTDLHWSWIFSFLSLTIIKMNKTHNKNFILTLVICFSFGVALASKECQGNTKLKCFECNSHLDSRCSDPFNWTTPPPMKQCDGCCVKIVQGLDTPDWKVVRSCTDDVDINMFMVDHVCMSEGGGRGKMCFCEENECNAAVPSSIQIFSSQSKVNLMKILVYPIYMIYNYYNNNLV